MFSEPVQAGFALAATIARDRGAVLARPGVTTSAAELSALARELEQLSSAERRARIRQLAARALPAPVTHTRARDEPRARLPVAAGRALPPPRAGFVPEHGLVVLLARIARRTAGR